MFVEPGEDIRPGIYPADRGIRHYGFLLEVLEAGTAGTLELSRHTGGERYFLELVDRRPIDRWERVRRNELLSQYGSYLGLVHVLGSPVLLEPPAVVATCAGMLRLPDRHGRRGARGRAR